MLLDFILKVNMIVLNNTFLISMTNIFDVYATDSSFYKFHSLLLIAFYCNLLLLTIFNCIVYRTCKTLIVSTIIYL